MPGIRRVDVAHQPARDLVVLARLGGPENQRAPKRVPEADAVLRMGIFDRVPDLQSGTMRIDVRQEEAVAMPQPGAPHRPSIVVDGDRAVQDLVTGVAVDVATLTLC